MKRAPLAAILALGTFGSLGILGALASCSLFTDFASLSNGDNGDKEAGVAETGAETSVGDATTDAGIALDASGCARFTDASFCVDFEGPSPTTSPTWTKSELDTADVDSGTIALTTVDPVSPPNAVRIAASGVTGSCHYLRLIKGFSGAATALTTRYRVRAESESVHFALATKGSPGHSFSVLVGLGSPRSVGLIVQRNDNGNVVGVAQENGDLATTWLDRWLDVRLEVITLPSPKVTLQADEVRIEIALPADFGANEPEVAIGGYCFASNVALDFDDLATWISR